MINPWYLHTAKSVQIKKKSRPWSLNWHKNDDTRVIQEEIFTIQNGKHAQTRDVTQSVFQIWPAAIRSLLIIA